MPASEGVSIEVAETLKTLERESRELHQANDVLSEAPVHFALPQRRRRFKSCSSSSTIIAGACDRIDAPGATDGPVDLSSSCHKARRLARTINVRKAR